MLTEIWEIVLINVIMLIAALIAVYMIYDGEAKSQDQKNLRTIVLVAFVVIHASRFIPFLLIALGKFI